MERKSQYFSHEYADDTLIDYVNTGAYSVLTCSFVNEDPDCGVESICYTTTDRPARISEMAYELLQEVKDVLDFREGSVKETTVVPVERTNNCEDCTTTALIAFENALKETSADYTPVVRNNSGNIIQILTVNEAADVVLKNIANSGITGFDVFVGDIDGHNITEFVGNNYLGVNGSWYGIKWIALDMFDGNKTDRIVLIGHYGGGYTESMYVNISEDYFKDELITKMCYAFDANSEDKILLETKNMEVN